MLRTSLKAGLCVAGMLVLAPVSALAAGPSDKCRDGAAACREAFEKLEKCQHASGKKADKKDDAKKEETAAKDAKKDDAKKDADDTCAPERSATDAACKTSNSACVKDGSKHAPHARKG